MVPLLNVHLANTVLPAAVMVPRLFSRGVPEQPSHLVCTRALFMPLLPHCPQEDLLHLPGRRPGDQRRQSAALNHKLNRVIPMGRGAPSRQNLATPVLIMVATATLML